MDQRITIKIGEREYGLKAETEEQEMTTRKAADMLNKKIALYSSRYPTKDTIDVLSFVCINQCIGNLRLQAKLENETKNALEFNAELENYLKNIEK